MDPASANEALVHRPFEPEKRSEDVALQKLWLATQRRPWRTLAFIGLTPSVDTLSLAQLFAKLAWWYSGEPSCTFDLRELSLRLVEYHQQEVAAQAQTGARIFIALGPTGTNPTAIPMGRSADGILLVVERGKAKIDIAKRTIEEVGRERFLGAIVLKSPSPNPSDENARGRR
jgi:hypothetical protein